jgi:hypothetical protein
VAVGVQAALQVVQGKQLRHMATAQVVVVHCLVVVAEDQQAVVRAEAALEAQSVLSTPALHANSHQLTWRIHK